MAVQEDDHVSKIYYKAYKSKVVREWYGDEAPDGFLNESGVLLPKRFSRVTPESGKKVWYRNYIFRGILTSAYEKYNDKIEAMQFHIEIDGDSVLTVNSGSGQHKSFLMAMANFPNNEEIVFAPYNFTDKESGKQRIGMTFKYSGGDKIEPFYTRDNPNGLPQPTSKSKGGKKIWNWSKQEDFLDTAFDEWNEEYFSNQEDFQSQSQQSSSPPDLEPATTEELPATKNKAQDGDVPF